MTHWETYWQPKIQHALKRSRHLPVRDHFHTPLYAVARVLSVGFSVPLGQEVRDFSADVNYALGLAQYGAEGLQERDLFLDICANVLLQKPPSCIPRSGMRRQVVNALNTFGSERNLGPFSHQLKAYFEQAKGRPTQWKERCAHIEQQAFAQGEVWYVCLRSQHPFDIGKKGRTKESEVLERYLCHQAATLALRHQRARPNLSPITKSLLTRRIHGHERTLGNLLG